MLTPISPSEMPQKVRGKERSAMSLFAERTAAEFVKGFGEGQVAEVTGWPLDEGRDATWCAAKAANAIRDRLFALDPDRDLRKEVRVTRSGERVFMRRLRPRSRA